MVEVGVTAGVLPKLPLWEANGAYVVPEESLDQLQERDQRNIHDMIDFSTRAEELGVDYVFHPEHHFTLWGGNSPDPVQIQTAIATQTREIRLVQLANIISWHDPTRLAERTAMLDIISRGRVEVGLGTGSRSREEVVLGQDDGTTASTVKRQLAFEEAYQLLLAAWTEHAVNFDGDVHSILPGYTEYKDNQKAFFLKHVAEEHGPDDFFKSCQGSTVADAVPVGPQPQQSPHPQLWRPISSPRAAHWAGRHGVNGCCICTTPKQAKKLIDVYHEAAEEAGWPDHRSEYDGQPLRRGWDSRSKRGLAARLPIFDTSVSGGGTIEQWKRGYQFALTDGTVDPEKGTRDVESDIASPGAPLVGDSATIASRFVDILDTCGYEDVILALDFNNAGLTHEEEIRQLESFMEDTLPDIEDQL